MKKNIMLSNDHKLDTEINEKDLLKFRIHYRSFNLLRRLNIKNRKFKDTILKSDIFNLVIERFKMDSIVSVKNLDLVEAVLIGYNFDAAALTVPSKETLGNSDIYFIDSEIDEEQTLIMTIVTALHEVKHAMQNKLGQLESGSYIKQEEGFASYMEQPVEVSANNFALKHYKRFYKELIKDLR